MTKLQQRVKHFMKSVGQSVPDKPLVPDNLTRVLRVSLLLEEVLEFAEASGIEITVGTDTNKLNIDSLNYNIVGDVDMVEVIDGLCDIGYVAQGAGCSYGVDLEPFEDEVCDSNDSKLVDGYRREDGKWCKGQAYRPANLGPILEKQLNK